MSKRNVYKCDRCDTEQASTEYPPEWASVVIYENEYRDGKKENNYREWDYCPKCLETFLYVHGS